MFRVICFLSPRAMGESGLYDLRDWPPQEKPEDSAFVIYDGSN